MIIKKFEKKYNKLGGIAKLTELRSLYFSQGYIAKHFGVSNQRVKQWMLEFFGQMYDSREDREEAIKLSMIDFAKNNSIEEFNCAFKKTTYYKKVLKEIKKQKIYDIK